MRGWRKCAGCARRTSRSTAATASERQLVPGRSWAAWSRALGLLLPPLDVADLGCGEGYLTIEAARWARQVIAIDRSADVLVRGKALADAAPREEHHLEARRARAAAARRRVGRRRAAVAGAAPRRAIPAARSPRRTASCGRAAACSCSICASTTRPGCATQLGDRWLGFDDEELQAAHGTAGFDDVTRPRRARGVPGDPFTVLIAAGARRPRTDRRSATARLPIHQDTSTR